MIYKIMIYLVVVIFGCMQIGFFRNILKAKEIIERCVKVKYLRYDQICLYITLGGYIAFNYFTMNNRDIMTILLSVLLITNGFSLMFVRVIFTEKGVLSEYGRSISQKKVTYLKEESSISLYISNQKRYTFKKDNQLIKILEESYPLKQ